MPAILKKKIIPEPTDECASGMEISVIDAFGKQKEKRLLGVLSAAQVYEWIHEGQRIDLKNRYVKDFHLGEYRRLKGLEPDAPVTLLDFDAEGAFFDSEEEIDFSYAVFTGFKAHFRRCAFGDGRATFYHTQFQVQHVDFEEAQFASSVINFQYADFQSGSTSFDNALIATGDLQFVSANFHDGKVGFRNVDFGPGSVDFHYGRFGKGNISFDKSVFRGGDVSFKRVDFGDGKVDFKRVRFGDGEIDFSEAEFRTGKVIFRSSVFGAGRISFEEVTSESDFAFDNSEFGTGAISFFRATMYRLTFQLCKFNNYVDLRVQKAHRIDLSYSIVRDMIDLIPTERAAVRLNQLHFNGMRNLGQIYIDWRQNRVLKMIMGQEDTTMRQKSEQFLILKETYNATGRYADEDKAYVWYKRMELKADLQHAVKKRKRNAIWAYPTAFFKWLLFDIIGLYATEPLRVLLSVAIIYTVFSGMYIVLPWLVDTKIDTGAAGLAELGEVYKAFYFSAITFLTVGYGDFYPIGILRILASVEGYVGVFLMGYFSVAFVRKVLR